MYKRTFELKNEWTEKYPEDSLHLLVIGGTHGNESNAVKMVSKFVKRLESNDSDWWEKYKH